jgi:hypothetical protein
MERGETAADAAASARREFGNVGLAKEVTRDVWDGAGSNDYLISCLIPAAGRRT